jgi:glycosyltransferase involved in cell wall biosynthesis
MLKSVLNSPFSPIPLVSVSITAFNLEKWLPRALDSVLMQRMDFPIEIVIGDDASTDGTLSIAQAYRDKHPDMIRVMERTRNVGVLRNTYDTLDACRGKYTAFLDGDDYWTDPEKLAVQVGVLESNPTVSVCGHFVRWVDSGGEVRRERFPGIAPGKYGIEEILRHNFIPALSAMFRTGVHRQLPEWYFGLGATSDWPLWVVSALSGDIILLESVMADYMLTPGSIFMSKGSLYWYKSDAQFYDVVESILPSKLQRIVRSEKGNRYEAMAYLLRKQGDFSGSREAALKAFRSPFLLDNCASKTKSLLAASVREMQSKFKQGRTAQEQ